MIESRDAIEKKIEELCAELDFAGAAAVIVRGYGPEIFGFLAAQHKAEATSKLAEIREALPPEDRMRLVLRLDKGLDWNDVARVMLGEEAPIDEGSLKRAAQRERKRFQILKERLIEEGRRAGLLGSNE